MGRNENLQINHEISGGNLGSNLYCFPIDPIPICTVFPKVVIVLRKAFEQNYYKIILKLLLNQFGNGSIQAEIDIWYIKCYCRPCKIVSRPSLSHGTMLVIYPTAAA